MRRSNQRRDAVFACYQQEVTDRPLSVLLADAKPFTIELAEGVEANREELDEVIAEYARGWELNRIAPLEKNIMRVALYEMNFREDVPAEVAIDEAVETAKKFCGAEAPGFVNGILGSAARAMGVDPGERDTEVDDEGVPVTDIDGQIDPVPNGDAR
ncbi:MAG: transcription antitermination factor NusB [Solirubrobacterales bacterium]|nr:transcription antitermination factor NusB [Solirubrobacterales bacterium]